LALGHRIGCSVGLDDDLPGRIERDCVLDFA
jgi:hypothetical protein